MKKEPLRTTRTTYEDLSMLTLEKALEMGLTIYADDRHFCTECAHYKHKDWKGKCFQGVTQFASILNRCSKFEDRFKPKEVLTEDKFWE